MTFSGSASDAQDRIDQQASEWVVLASDRDLTHDEQSELSAWLDADPRHRDAWRAFESIWATIPALPGFADETMSELDMQAGVAAEPRPRSFVTSRRTAIAFGAIAAAFAGILFVPAMLNHDQTFRTGVSQTQYITLADGSQVTLGPRSSLEVRFRGGERRVALNEGEAFFEVVHDPRHPFTVDAGDAQTRVLGTKFDVNHADGSVRVGVAEGMVQVRRDDPEVRSGNTVAYLRAGEGAEVTLSGARRGIHTYRVPAPGAWRDGRLIYDNSRLADLVADANRYYAPGVTISDPDTGQLRITASFKPSEIAAFMSAVGNVVPVSARQQADGSFRISAASSVSRNP